MSSPASSPRRPVLLLLAALALLGVTGCNAGNPLNPPAARVGDVEISDETLHADVEAEEDPPEGATQSLDILGQSEGTYRADVVAFKLADRVRSVLVERLIEQEEIEITEEQSTSARQQLCGGVDQQTGQPADCSSFEAYPADYQEYQVEHVARQIALAERFGTELQEGLQQEYDELVDDEDSSLAQSCFDATGFSTEQEAQAAAETLPEAAFEELSQQYQELGCIPFERRDELPAELAGIEDGQVSGVLADPSGVFVLARRSDSVQEFSAWARTRIQGGTGLTDEILKEQLGRVKVQVDPRYGRWDADAFRVVGNERPEGVAPPETAAG